jgi:mannosyltransferase
VLTPERLLTFESPAEILEPTPTPAPASAPPWWRRLPDRAWVGALVLLAFLLRVPTIGRYYWVDEAISIGMASHPLRELPSLLRLDGSPPLWYVILHFWLEIFGSSSVSTHSLSMLISLAAVPLAYWAGRELFGRPAALAAAALAATNPFLNWYATENRMYTLVVVLSLVALTLTIKAVRTRSQPCAVGAVIAFAALDYTQNWGLYLTAAASLYLLVRAAHAHDRKLVTWTLGCSAAVVTIYAPWIPSLFHQAGSTAAPWAVPPAIGDFFADPSTAVGGTIGVIIAPLLVGGVLLTRKQRNKGTSQVATLLVSVTLATTIMGWLCAQIEPSWTVRYLAVTVPGWLLAAAGALAPTRLGRRVVAVACALLMVWSVVGTFLPNPDPDAAKDNGASIATNVSGALRPGDMVIVTETEQIPVMHYYLPAGLKYYSPMGRVADPSVVNWTNIIKRLNQANICQTLLPAIRALPVGARILEVDPENPKGTKGSAWYKAVNEKVVNIEDLLANEPSLNHEGLAEYTSGMNASPYTPLLAVMFVKQKGATLCHPSGDRH